MTLRMADGPPRNLPPGMDAYAGYVDLSGIGVTWPAVAALPARNHLSISVHGNAAMCGDVEGGALSSWTGYTYGYCSIANAQRLIDTYGRPKKLWIAHYGAGAHICGPQCGYGFTGTADGTQWVDHGGWDESLLADDFFTLQPLPPIQPPEGVTIMDIAVAANGDVHIVGRNDSSGNTIHIIRTAGQTGYQSIDVTDAIHAEAPANEAIRLS